MGACAAWLLIVSLVGFVRLYLRAGRRWLVWAVWVARTLSLILNFVCTPNVNYREITALWHIPFLGESVSVAEIEQRLATLTPREREVMEHVISGQLNKQTAADLGTVEKTIKVHRARVMEKMKAHSVAELVRLAERVGIRPGH